MWLQFNSEHLRGAIINVLESVAIILYSIDLFGATTEVLQVHDCL